MEKEPASPADPEGVRLAHPQELSSHQARLQLEDRTPVSPSHPFQPFGPGPYRSPGWPPGPGTGGCGGTRRRPAGSSGAGARALAPALAPAPAPGPARAQALMWDMEAGWALVLSAGHGATKHRDGGPSLPGSRTVLKRNRIQEQDHGGGGWAGGCGPPHKASSHDKGIQPHHPRSQHLVTATQRDLRGKKNGSWFRDMCVHPTPSFLLKPSTLPIGCVCAWHAGTSVCGGCNTSRVRMSVSSPGGLGRGGAAYPSWPCSPGSTRFSPGRAPAPHKSAAGR